MASANTNRMSRDDFKKAKELEELRKTGAAPPELDEDGKMINPHIPQYISQAPWYLNQSRPGLKHQRTSHWGAAKQKNVAGMDTWYERGKTKASDDGEHRKFKPGSCENCGATTHKKKDCVERPRRRGAKLTGEHIADDERIVNLQFDFDGKRDRWNGYDPAEYKKVIELHDKVESERKKKKLQELDQQMMKKKQRKLEAAAAGEEIDSDSDDEDDMDDDRDGGERHVTKEVELNPAVEKERKKARAEARRVRREERQKKRIDRKLKLEAAIKDALASNKPAPATAKAAGISSDSDQTDTDSDQESDEEMRDKGESIQKMDAKSRTTVRNLRIREDTAKYLRNLNPHSAHYDPKTRSMRDNPHPNNPGEDAIFAGDNFVRATGEVRDINALTSFVMNANEHGNDDIHAQALPSQAQMMFEQFKQKKEALKVARKKEILDKYGGTEHLNTLPKELLYQQQEQYVEYGEDGKLIKGVEKAIPRTKYAEDTYEQNHTEVWGSYWKDGKWGYGCCYQIVRHAFCTGEAGKQAVQEISNEMARAAKQQAFAAASQSKQDAAQRQAEMEARLESEMKEQEQRAKEIANKKRKQESSESDSDSDTHKKKKKKKKKQDDDDDDDDDPKLKAMIEAEKKKLAEKEGYGKNTGRYNSMHDAPEPSAEELEKFQRARPSHEDPMANYVDTEID